MTRFRFALAATVVVCALVLSASASNNPVTSKAPAVIVQVTEEGQHVVFDGYTWQRRELDKRLPLDQPWPSEDGIAKTFAQYGLANPPMPQWLAAPSTILPGIYLVGSFPNNTYLIDAGHGGLILVDPGLTMNYAAIIANVERLGYAKSQIRWVINTHGHFDHSMADALFRKAGAKILVGEGDAAAVEKATLATEYTLIPPEMQTKEYPRSKVDERLSDGEVLHLGDRTLYAIHTPGHTAGSMCFMLQSDGKNILISGDTLLYDHRLGWQDSPFADNRAYLASLAKLAKFSLDSKGPVRWDVLLPGHGTLVLDRADTDVKKGWHTIEIDAAEGQPVAALPFATDEYRALMFGRP